MDKDDMLVVFFGAIGVLLISGLVVFSVIEIEKEAEEEDAAWQVFSNQHNCHVIEHRDSQHGHGYTFSTRPGGGTVSVTIPEQTAYLCDDGVTYWREE